MKMFMRILLLVVILALGISGGGIQPAQAQSPAKPKTVQVDGELHLLLYWIDYQSISQGPASESNNYVYNLDI